MLENTRKDFLTLWNFLMPWAEQQIKDHGTFAAIGAALRPDDGIELSITEPMENPREFIEAQFRDAAHIGKYKAVSIISDVRATTHDTDTPFDAIYFTFDDVNNDSSLVLQPYTIDAENNILLEKAHVNEGAHSIFPNNPSGQ